MPSGRAARVSRFPQYPPAIGHRRETGEPDKELVGFPQQGALLLAAVLVDAIRQVLVEGEVLVVAIAGCQGVVAKGGVRVELNVLSPIEQVVENAPDGLFAKA